MITWYKSAKSHSWRCSDFIVMYLMLRVRHRQCYVNIAFVILWYGACVVVVEPREYCQWENFNASCPAADEVVLMKTARYGRIRFGRCMREDHGSVGCAADVLAHLDRKCSGRRRCRMMIPDATLHSIHPCPKELMPYLEASYLCVRGTLPAPRQAASFDGLQPVLAACHCNFFFYIGK